MTIPKIINTSKLPIQWYYFRQLLYQLCCKCKFTPTSSTQLLQKIPQIITLGDQSISINLLFLVMLTTCLHNLSYEILSVVRDYY